jgi:hypothetical protein
VSFGARAIAYPVIEPVISHILMMNRVWTHFVAMAILSHVMALAQQCFKGVDSPLLAAARDAGFVVARDPGAEPACPDTLFLSSGEQARNRSITSGSHDSSQAVGV